MKTMIFRYWKLWFKSQPWSFKWFLWVTLLMPVMSLFWDLKKTAGISPLQILGFLIVLVSIKYSFSLKVKLKKSFFVFWFAIFTSFFILNNFFFLFNNFSYNNAGFFLRNILPIFLFIYLIKFLKTKKQIEGFFITFLISSIFPLLMLFYETVFHPIKYVYIQESRGGGVRLTGFYADMFNYMSYVIGDFVIFSYFYIKSLIGKSTLIKVSHKNYFFIIFLTIVGLIGLKHQASWGVFVTLILLIMFYLSKLRKGRSIVILYAVIIFSVGSYFIKDIFEKLFSKDIAVAEGRIDKRSALNGRVARWERYFDYWNETRSISKVVGMTFADLPYHIKRSMLSGGMHSDYVRFLFSSGIIGLMAYLFSLFNIWQAKQKFAIEDKFIINSSLIIFLLYSISANPFLASGTLMYLVLVVFAGALKPLNIYYS